MTKKNTNEKEVKKFTLSQLAEKYPTDKGESGHNYIPYYKKHLPLNPKRLLEIGVWKGDSIKMWKEYFPDTEIHGMDLFQEFPEVKDELENLGVICHKGDAHNIDFLWTIKDKFDIIILDGSHHPGFEQRTFYHLFMINLMKNGVFYWEDLHTSLDSYWYHGDLDDFKDTALNFLKSWSEGNIISTKFLGEHEIGILKPNIDALEIFDNKLAIIWKK
jgi:hypothetical protein